MARCPLSPPRQKPSASGASARPRRDRRLSHRDRLWARRRCARRARRRQGVRGQGAAALQPADRACAGPRRGRGVRRGERRCAEARRSFLAGPVVARAPASAPLAELPTWSAPGLDTIALSAPAHPGRASTARRGQAPHRRAERQPVGTDQPDHGGACGGRARRPARDDPRRRPLPSRHRSTVVSVVGNEPALLRPGAVPREAIERVLGGAARRAKAKERAASPGQLATPLCAAHAAQARRDQRRSDEALLAFGPDVPAGAGRTINLSPSGNLEEAAAKLFAALRELDQAGRSSHRRHAHPGQRAWRGHQRPLAARGQSAASAHPMTADAEA